MDFCLRTRVASALKWGFADFDDLGVDADRQTLSPEDFAKVMDLLKLRPMQFCIFLKTLVGGELDGGAAVEGHDDGVLDEAAGGLAVEVDEFELVAMQVHGVP